MKKYDVELKEIEIYFVEWIEAESEEEAEEKASELIQGDGKEKYHQDSDGEVEAYEV